ncbi:MAG: triose-phosphate isomerase [Saprospirales bacterium]|nr:triose-phosphate isomerase [Saprospirales bacterium]
MKRLQIVAGNWKMNKTFDEGRELATAIINGLGSSENLVIICPPFIHLNHLATVSKGISNFYIGAQNCHFEKSGAYTGEVSVPMLKSCGVGFVITGHSERRTLFGETDEVVKKKVDAILEEGLRPIFCCGEPLEVREAGKHFNYVEDQIKAALFHLDKEAFGRVVIAYEPIWAIGTGKTASPDQAQEMHARIRKLISGKYDIETAERTTILYGGSCKPSNAKELFSQADIDGGLIGGASLKAEDFLSIIKSLP